MAWIESNLDKIAKNIKDFVLLEVFGCLQRATLFIVWGSSIFARIFVKAAPETPCNTANAMMTEW
jgi:hypothetical protein